jgi:aarF domain-containing kinase
MAWGAASESVRRAAGGTGDNATAVMFSEGNVERLVKKLSRMRGAALKLGQMMSFQGISRRYLSLERRCF